MAVLFFLFCFVQEPPYCFSKQLHQFAIPPTMNENSLSSISLLTLFICCLFADNHPDRCEVLYHCGFDLYFTDSDAEDLFMCLLAIRISSSEKFLFMFSSHLLTGLFAFLNFSCMYSLTILNIHPSSDISFANIFYHSLGCLFV